MTDAGNATAALHALRPGARLHLIGVAGSGMNALAAVLLARGYRLSGSDRQRSAQVDRLQQQGLVFSQGHDPANCRGADMVIISAAIHEDNTEMAAAQRYGIPVVKRAAALGWLLEGQRTIGVAGTHGKTTTTSLLAVTLQRAGLDPTFAVGGDVLDLGASARWGSGQWAVVEADEYDRSFLQLRPTIALITNVEPDHLEYFGTARAMEDAFVQYVARLEPGGSLVLNADDAFLRGMRPAGIRTVLCAVEPDATAARTVAWYAKDIRAEGDLICFTVHSGTAEEEPLKLRMRLAGRHNVSNALQAYAAARLAGVPSAAFSAALEAFRGAGRRFEVVGTAGGVLVIDDYAHHPTEVRASLAAARMRFSERRIVVVFQPHTFSRTKLLFDDFVGAFDGADLLVLTDIYAARETDTLGMDASQLRDAIAARPGGPAVRLVRDVQDVPAALAPDLRQNDVVLTAGAGTITTVGSQLLSALRGLSGF